MAPAGQNLSDNLSSPELIHELITGSARSVGTKLECVFSLLKGNGTLDMFQPIEYRSYNEAGQSIKKSFNQYTIYTHKQHMMDW